MTLTVRRIANGDGPLLKTVRLAALHDDPGNYLTTLADAEGFPDGRWEDVAGANSSGANQAIWFAEARDEDDDEPQPAGMLAAFRTFDDVVTLTSLWAAPGFRQVGVADALVEAATRWAVQGRGRWLRLWMRERNEEVRRFYEEHGFSATGASMAYEPDPRQREVELRKRLAPG